MTRGMVQLLIPNTCDGDQCALIRYQECSKGHEEDLMWYQKDRRKILVCRVIRQNFNVSYQLMSLHHYDILHACICN